MNFIGTSRQDTSLYYQNDPKSQIAQSIDYVTGHHIPNNEGYQNYQKNGAYIDEMNYGIQFYQNNKKKNQVR